MFVIPSYALAEAVVAPASGEVVARWLALSLTAFGMVASAGIAWGVAKANLSRLERAVDGLAAAGRDYPTRSECQRLHELEARVARAEMGAVREIAEMVKGSLDQVGEQVAGLRKDLTDDRREMFAALEKTHSRINDVEGHLLRRSTDRAKGVVEGP